MSVHTERTAVLYAIRQGDRCRNYGPEHTRTENENCIVTLADEVERLMDLLSDLLDGEGLYESEYDGTNYESCLGCSYQSPHGKREHEASCPFRRGLALLKERLSDETRDGGQS